MFLKHVNIDTNPDFNALLTYFCLQLSLLHAKYSSKLSLYLQFKQYKRKLWQGLGKEEDVEKKPRVVVVLVETIVFIFFFTSVLMLIPAAIFSALEDDGSGEWDYLNSVYYTFITLSTVGFGDMVPGRIKQ